jgi:hypothetical protein
MYTVPESDPGTIRSVPRPSSTPLTQEVDMSTDPESEQQPYTDFFGMTDYHKGLLEIEKAKLELMRSIEERKLAEWRSVEERKLELIQSDVDHARAARDRDSANREERRLLDLDKDAEWRAGLARDEEWKDEVRLWQEEVREMDARNHALLRRIADALDPVPTRMGTADGR